MSERDLEPVGRAERHTHSTATAPTRSSHESGKTASGRPKHAVGPLTLDGANDVTGLGQRMGIDATYEQARAKVEQLLGEGQEYLGRLADTLLAVAADYEAREHASGSSFNQKDAEGN